MNKKNVFGILVLLFAAYSMQNISAMDNQIEKHLSEQKIEKMYNQEMEEMFNFSETLRKSGYTKKQIEQEESKETERINWRRKARNKLRIYPNYDLSRLSIA